MSKNRRGHRGGRKHHRNRNVHDGSGNEAPRNNQPTIYTPGMFVRDNSDRRDPKRKSFWSCLKPLCTCYGVAIRAIVWLPVLIFGNISMLIMYILGCKKPSDEFCTWRDFMDLVSPDY